MKAFQNLLLALLARAFALHGVWGQRSELSLNTPSLQQAVLAANASIQLIYREYQIPILSPNDIAELYLELLEFVFIQV